MHVTRAQLNVRIPAGNYCFSQKAFTSASNITSERVVHSYICIQSWVVVNHFPALFPTSSPSVSFLTWVLILTPSTKQGHMDFMFHKSCYPMIHISRSFWLLSQKALYKSKCDRILPHFPRAIKIKTKQNYFPFRNNNVWMQIGNKHHLWIAFSILYSLARIWRENAT